MEQEHIDPVYKYIDDKIKPIARELKNIKQSHDAFTASMNDKAAKLEAILLETRRYVASQSVEDLRLFLETKLGTDLPRNADVLRQKAHDFLVAESAKAKQAIIHSQAPISIAEQFEKACHDFFVPNNLPGFEG